MENCTFHVLVTGAGVELEIWQDLAEEQMAMVANCISRCFGSRSSMSILLSICFLTLSVRAVFPGENGQATGELQVERQRLEVSSFMPEVELYRSSLVTRGIRLTKTSLAKYLSSRSDDVRTERQQAVFSRLAKELGDDDYFVRETATAKLKVMGTNFAQELRELSRTTDDPEVRVRALKVSRAIDRVRRCTPVDALHVIARDQITGLVPEILGRLDSDQRSAVSIAAERALVASAQDEECRLIQQHVETTKHHHSKLVCIRAISRNSAVNSVSLFQQLLKDPSPEIRLAAGIGLARAGDTTAMSSLVDLLESDSFTIRHQAANVLQRWQQQFFGFRAAADIESRRGGSEKWRNYVSNQDYVEAAFRPPKRLGHVLAVRENTLFEFDSDGNVVHQKAGFESLSNATALENGNLLVTDRAGAVYEFDRNWKQVKKTELTFEPLSAFRFPDGGMIVLGSKRIWFSDQSNEPTRVAFFRRISKGALLLPGKRLLFWSNDDRGLVEIDWHGQLDRRTRVEYNPHSIEMLKDGRFLVSDTRQAAIYESNNPKPIWSHSLPGIRSASALASGNYLLGHEAGLTIVNQHKDVLWEWEQPRAGGDGFCATIF
ncbi:HEAT repeat domain-containing protein [Planctomycetota bacterium]